MKKNKGITLIALVVTIIILLILGGVSIATLTGKDGLLNRTSEAKIMTAIGTVKEQIKLEQMENLMDNQKNSSVEQMLADGKVKRTVQPDGEIYYMYYAIKPDAYPGMQGLGKGIPATLRDVFLIDDDFNVKYIDKSGKEYGDNIGEKILEDETEIRFANKAFGEYVSLISGATETKMKFEWMKNQTSLTIADSSVDSLEDLVFFPNLTHLTLTNLTLNNLDGIENCNKMTNFTSRSNIKDYSRLSEVTNLKQIATYNELDFDNLIDSIKNHKLETVVFYACNIKNMEKISELSDTIYSIYMGGCKIKEVKGIDNFTNLTGLILSNNEITDILSFSEMKSIDKLKLLDLSGNSGIDGNRANYTTEELEKLDIIGKILERGGNIILNKEQFGLFNNYTNIELENQKLDTLDMFTGMTQVTRLSLRNNNITLSDESSRLTLKNMKKLTVLNLSMNKLTNITSINELENLKSLWLQDNPTLNLKEIEDIISNLDTLIVDNDTLKTIVNCDPNKITTLNLSGYINPQFTKIPDMSSLTNLKNFSIVDAPNIEDFSTLKNLSRTNITKNKPIRITWKNDRFFKINQLNKS